MNAYGSEENSPIYKMHNSTTQSMQYMKLWLKLLCVDYVNIVAHLTKIADLLIDALQHCKVIVQLWFTYWALY